ncbi:ABC transporter ATP-binding protein [Celeribacter marinus]|uniref:Glycerol-3-phosphate ABC transporter, ATP-binding protein UgpC n=1 Tax=Celeribacter marinus TaxID=1397108 RepID=A0A0N9ZHY3_9RHOB|nr:sn-glycerol-3-phosphate ABC transporter ATP-binding protein UgpC [Celeribacter marinus]ALI56257.1 glycerol-3-phosphate ABC transporter, ATP-binding protein UgpC [Celeribacter marinus]SFK83942.1 carbohydrate ABC transporter ATP-binding protein, CUT1 family [Celeribacter marinus]
MSAPIEITNLTKRYGAVTVLSDISLSIDAGEFVVFLGPSGCGKSTLLRMIAGLEAVDGGEIHLGGARIDALPPGQRGVAMVFQSYALYPHMTVAQNMSFGLENIGTGKADIERRVTETAKVLEIDHLLDRKPAKLSGGQRQRVAIGRAITKEPKAFLFDEPLSNLDAALRGRTRLELAQLHRRLGATMIFVTHDQVEAMTLADRIVILNNQGIEQVGTPMDIYHRPVSKFVAGFVGSPAMSFLPIAAVTSSTGGTVVSVDAVGDIDTNVVVPEYFKPQGAEIGIRAEDAHVIRDGSNGLRLSVDVVERLGERTLIYGTLDNGSEIVVEDDGRSDVTTGTTICVSIDAASIHIFDADGQAYPHKEPV